jgi:hypothetical protein
MVLPQPARHLISPQRDGVGLSDWWHDDVLRLMYESDSQDQGSIRKLTDIPRVRGGRREVPAAHVAASGRKGMPKLARRSLLRSSFG